MKLTYAGWARDHGAKDILPSRGLGKEEIADEITSYDRSKTYVTVHRSASGRPFAKISAFANMRTNGDYLVEVTLTQNDLHTLFAAVNRDSAWSEVNSKQAELA